MSSRSSRVQDQQQQRAVSIDPFVPRSTTSTFNMMPGNGMNSQQSFSGVQGGSRSEPLRPRPSYPAPSTIHPDDSASLQPSQAGSDTSSRRSAHQFTIPNYGPLSAQMPQGTPQPTPYSAHSSASRGSKSQYAPPSFRSTQQGNIGGASQSRLHAPSSGPQQSSSSFNGITPTSSYSRVAPSQRSGAAPSDYELLPPFLGQNTPSNVGDYEPLPSVFASNAPSNARGTAAPSTVRSGNRASSGVTESITRGSATKSGAGMSTGAISQNRTVTPSANLPLYPGGPQQNPGFSLGVPPAAQVHLHYNQVDNRQVHVHNNAPRRMVTNNNQAYMMDNSNHHNIRAPQANTYHTHATNVGNTHTGVSQHATDARPSAYINSNGRQQGSLPPSELITLRGKQYKSVKKVSFNEWTDRRSVTYQGVPNDRPC